EAPDVPQELVGIEADAEVLDAERSALVYDRRQEGVIDVASRILPRIDAVAPPDVPDLGRCARQERPARGIRAVIPGVLRENRRRVALGIHGDRHKPDLRTEIGAKPLLDLRHLSGEQRTRVGTRSVYEGHRHDLPPELAQREP